VVSRAKGPTLVSRRKSPVQRASRCCLTAAYTPSIVVSSGCKYSDEDCPVVLQTKKQSYRCEQCEDDHIEGVPDPSHEDYDVLQMHEFQLRDEVRRLRGLLRERGVDVSPPPEIKRVLQLQEGDEDYESR